MIIFRGYPHRKFMQSATEIPENHRLSDACELQESLHDEEKEAVECDEEWEAPDSVSSDIPMKIYAKPAIIQSVNNKKHRKANRIRYDRPI